VFSFSLVILVTNKRETMTWDWESGTSSGGIQSLPRYLVTIYNKIGIIVVQSVRSIEFSCWVGRSVSAAREPRLGVEELINAK